MSSCGSLLSIEDGTLSVVAEPEAAVVCLLGQAPKRACASWPSGAANQTAERADQIANRPQRRQARDFFRVLSAVAFFKV